MIEPPVLVLPGFGDSGPSHWQTLWESRYPDWRRVPLGQWDAPVCADWVTMLDETVRRCAAPPVLVAHSLACLLVARWAEQSTALIHAALLVAVPEPGTPKFPPTARGFAPVPMHRLPFASMVVASCDDPFGSLEHAQRCATAWGSRFVDIGEAGHINADSHLGGWPAGLVLLKELVGAL
ncbi:MAG: alpha/beta hydrolase [Nitrospira sp.]